MTARHVDAAFRKMSLVAIAVISLITAMYALDLIFSLGWGYTTYDLKLGLVVLVFAVALRSIGLKIIRFVDDSA